MPISIVVGMLMTLDVPTHTSLRIIREQHPTEEPDALIVSVLPAYQYRSAGARVGD